jgi:hypothetical protein
MKRFCTSLACSSLAVAILVALGGGVLTAPAVAAPPTVTPSPGYDARLQEQRAARTVHEAVPPVSTPKPVSRRHAKRVHDDAH